MHRRSNLQCGELFSDFSVNGFGYSCNPCYLPQNMRPYSNRICNTYDYTKNGPRTMFINPAKNCSQPTNTIVMDTATEGTTVLPTETVVQTEVIEPTQTPASEQFRIRRKPVVRRTRKEKFTNGKVVENLAPVTVATRVTPAMFIPSTPFITQGQPVACLPGNNCGTGSAIGTVMEPVLLERNNFALPRYVPTVPVMPATVPTVSTVPTVATVTPVFTPTLTIEGPENIVYLDRY